MPSDRIAFFEGTLSVIQSEYEAWIDSIPPIEITLTQLCASGILGKFVLLITWRPHPDPSDQRPAF